MPKNNLPTSLYIHIPFCDHICSYCDFTKLFYNHEFSSKYLEALNKELSSYNIGKQKTIYVGGGTPTSLKDDEFDKLLSILDKYFDSGCEFTLESNVENLTEQKLQIMESHHVNRLSIGIQSSNDKRLKEIGRHHSFKEAIQVVEMAKKHHFDSINVDLIYGFPNESIDELKKDLDNILKLDVDHISIYSLIVSPGTVFYNQKIKEQNPDDSRKYYDLILKTLRDAGYERYEISNFARNKKYSRHNLNYWHNGEYYGVGLGASGYIGNTRYTNTKNITKYLSGEYINEKEIINDEMLLEYYLITNLRLEQGFNRTEFKEIFGVDFAMKFSEKIKVFQKKSQIIIDNDKIRLSDDGLMIMDHILLNIL